MKTLLSTAAFILLLTTMHAQNVQWASRVVDKSSEYGAKQYGATQILGKPNAWPYGRESPCAWSSNKPESTSDFLTVGFETPMTIRQVAVMESFNPGTVTSIELLGPGGEVSLVYSNLKPRPIEEPFRILRAKFPPTKHLVESVRVHFRPNSVDGYNHIDAIGISDSEDDFVPAIHKAVWPNYDATPENLGPKVNSKYDEIMPLIAADGKTLYFDRKDHTDNSGGTVNDDIWFSVLDSSGKWSKAENAGAPLNNLGHNFLCSASGDCKTVLLGNRYLPNGNMEAGLSKSSRVNGKWQTPEPVEVKNYYNDNKFSEFSISPNCQFLIMAIQRKDGFGGKDLHVSFEEGSGYSQPLNLGPMINSAATEMSPFLAADGKTLFFATDGRNGYGNKDIFIARRLDDSWTKWTEPANLGPLINSNDWDGYFSVPASGEYGYFCSENASIGKTDIFRIKLPESLKPGATHLLKGRVIDEVTGDPLVGVLTCKARGSDKASDVLVYDPADGDVSMILSGGQIWEITIQSEGYTTKIEVFDLTTISGHSTQSRVWELSR